MPTSCCRAQGSSACRNATTEPAKYSGALWSRVSNRNEGEGKEGTRVRGRVGREGTSGKRREQGNETDGDRGEK